LDGVLEDLLQSLGVGDDGSAVVVLSLSTENQALPLRDMAECACLVAQLGEPDATHFHVHLTDSICSGRMSLMRRQIGAGRADGFGVLDLFWVNVFRIFGQHLRQNEEVV
jgi:hypothetical protein